MSDVPDMQRRVLPPNLSAVRPRRAGYLSILLTAIALAACTGKSPTAKTSATSTSVTDPSVFGFPAQTLPDAQQPAAKKAPFALTASDGTGLSLVSFEGKAVVEGPLAFTELHLTFDNPTDRVIEGRFTIDLPPNSAISRFAMKIGSHWQEGEVVERQAARVAYEDFLHRKQDPALLENQAGNQFSARVFPIPANGRKELIISYSQELPNSDERYRMELLGLPKLEKLDAQIILRNQAVADPGATSMGGQTTTNQVIELKKFDYAPDRDLEVPAKPGTVAEASGIRNGDLALVRVQAAGEMPPETIEDLTILFDTSASRALGFDRQVRRLGELVKAIQTAQGSDFRLHVLCFDQEVFEIYSGDVAGFGAQHIQAIFSRRAFGASDLAGALKNVAQTTKPGQNKRLLLVSDGVATAGGDNLADITPAAKGLQAAGYQRIDAVIDGGIQDRDVLEAITTAGLPSHGIVVDTKTPLATIGQKLTKRTLSGVQVSVPGSEWSWPHQLDGVQPGDEVLVYAKIPEATPLQVVLGSGDKANVVQVATRLGQRPMIERAWVGALIEDKTATHSKVDTSTEAGREQANKLKQEIVDLSTKHRVLSDFTALLVLETEWDYRRFNIDRNALADILTVGQDGVQLTARSGLYMPVTGETVSQTTGANQPIRDFDPDMAQRQAGILGVMQQQSGHFLASPYGGAFAVGNDDEDVWGGLTGNEIGEAYGVGGLGLVGTGRGGGGTGEGLNAMRGPSTAAKDGKKKSSRPRAANSGDFGEGTIGLGNTGLIGKGGGGGSGSGYGRGSGAGFGGRGLRVPRVRQGKAAVMGSLDKDIIRRIVRAHINEVRYCYNRGLAKKPSLAGRVEVEFIIAATGRVENAKVRRTNLADASVSQCIAKAVRRWKFPKPRGGGIVKVAYPFVLSPADGPSPPPLTPLSPEQEAAQQAAMAEAQRLAEQRAEAERQRRIQQEKEWFEKQEKLRLQREAEEAEAKRTEGSPYSGKLFDIMKLLEQQQHKPALDMALAWYDAEPGNVLALVGIGEALEASGNPQAAARVYGSIIDLFPSRADLRRYAGARLSRLGDVGLQLAVDTFAEAVEQRPDHPGSHRMYAYALARVGQFEKAFEAIEAGEGRDYPSGRFAGVKRILKDDLQILGAVWAHHEPDRRKTIEQRLQARGATIETRPSLRFIMGWETDSNDVDFHIRDSQDGHAWYSNKTLSSGGELYADVTTGYGPECFAIHNKASAYPYKLQAHYYSRGPMGYGMGALQVMEFDGAGTLKFDDRPFLIMKDRAYLDLGSVDGPLP